MAEEGFKRKLTAILSADVEGYSRLMGDDEEATVRTLTAYRDVLSTLIQQHNGKVLDSPGDNLLAEFVSVVDAVQCAVAVQKEIKARNDQLPENRRMQFRIGINLGDVIQEEDRIYGDGVNIAARLEGLAEPGGICISKTAFDHIESKLPYGYDFIGEQTVKNIAKPVGAYRVLMDPRVTVSGKPVGQKPVVLRRMPILVGVVAVLVLAVAVGIWQFYARRPTEEPASLEKMAFPLPEKPSIVVLPFANMSGEQNQEYISDGITETLITSLSKIPDLFVIARESSFYYKGKSVQIKQISEELGVRYVLEGSVQRSENRIRITAQLIDALKGHHLWAEKYDREFEDLFALQDDIALNVLRGLQVQLTVTDTGRGIGTNNIEAYLKLLQGLNQIYHWDKDDMVYARQLFKEAIALEPEYADAYNLMGYTHLWDAFFGWSKSPKESLDLAEELAQKAIGLDNSLPGPHGLVSMLYLTQGQCDKALAKSEQIVANHPNASTQIHILGMALSCVGRPEEAISLYKKEIRLNPYPQNYVIKNWGEAYFLAGRYEELIDLTNKWIHRYPDPFWTRWSHINLAAAYSLLGREEDAKMEVAKVLKTDPNMSLKWIEKRLMFRDQDDRNRFINALRKAGLPA
jgi:adenylate cyclase